MKITRYQHACMVLEEQGKRLVIDPGEFTDQFGGTDNVVAVVITHEHGDHFDPKHLEAITQANQDVVVFTTKQVADKLHNVQVQTPTAYEDYSAGPFTMRFFGETHALVHHTSEPAQNIGVLVNNAFYYPGDSLTPPDRDVQVVAVPASGPWLHVGQAIDFLEGINFKTFFATHDGLYNDNGHATINKWYSLTAERLHVAYNPLKPGESIEVTLP